MKHLIPRITEKSYRGIATDGEEASTYTFTVKGDLDKAQIKKLIEDEHKVTVVDVRTINLPGKVRRFKNIKGNVSGATKALIRLKAGDRIAAFDIEETQDSEKKSE